MPISDADENRRYQREWARKRAAEIQRGERPPRVKQTKRKVKAVRVPQKIHQPHPLIALTRANAAAGKRYAERLAKIPRVRENEWSELRPDPERVARLPDPHPHPEAPLLDVSAEMLPRALRILHAVVREVERRRSMQLLEHDPEQDGPCGSGVRVLANGTEFALDVRQEKKHQLEVVDSGHWFRERKEWVPHFTDDLEVRAGTKREHDTRSWKVEDRLGHLFDYLERHQQIADEAAAHAARHAEFDRKREEAAEARRAAERERARPALERARAEQEARRLERERLERERAQAAQRDVRIRQLISDRHALAAMQQLADVLAHRDDATATQWHAHACAWLEAHRPHRSPDEPLPPLLVAADVPRFTPVAVEPPEVFELSTPPIITSLQGADPFIKQLRENRAAAHRHERHERRWRGMYRSSDYVRRQQEKLGPRQPHRGVPVLDVPYTQLRLVLLITHAVMKLAKHANADLSLGPGWGDTVLRFYVLDRDEFSLTITGTHTRGGMSDSLRVKLGGHGIVVASFEQFAEQWDAFVQSIPEAINRRRTKTAQEAAAHANGEFAAQRAAEQKRLRNLVRYREQTLHVLAMQHDHVTAAQLLLLHAEHLDDDERADLELWIAAHDLVRDDVALPSYEPDQVPDFDKPDQPHEPPARPSSTSWEQPPKSWFQRRHGWWNR